MASIAENLRATLLSLKQISDRVKSLILSLFDFRSTLMGDNGTTRIRPLVVAKIVDSGTEHCGFMAQVPNEDKQVFYDGVTPDVGFLFTATKSEGLLSASEGQIDSFPLGVKSGAESFYPIEDWHVCTQAPQDITSAASTWQTAVVQVGEVWRCKEEHKYYNSSEEYIGSVYVYEKVGNSEVTLGEVKAAVENIDIDLTPVEEKVDEVSDKIDDIKDTFDADMALQLQGIIGESEESVEDNSLTEGEIERLRTLQESYDELAGNSSAIALETEVQAGKAAIVDAIEDKGGTATTTMSLTQMAQAIDSIQVPNPLRLTAVTFVNSVNNEVIDMGAIEYVNVATFNFSNFTTAKKIRNFPKLPIISNFNNMFQNCYALEEVEFGNRLETHNITSFANVFTNCTSLLEVDFSQIDTSALTVCNSFLYGCSSLKKAILPNFHFVGYVYYFIRNSPLVEYVDLKGSVASGLTQSSAIFDSSNILTTLVGNSTYQEVVDGNIGIFIGLNASLNLNFSQLPNLNVASLRALINGLADRTGQSALSFNMGSTNIAKLSADDIAVATNKNWTLA